MPAAQSAALLRTIFSFFVYLFKDTLTMLFCPVDLWFTFEMLFMFGKRDICFARLRHVYFYFEYERDRLAKKNIFAKCVYISFKPQDHQDQAL